MFALLLQAKTYKLVIAPHSMHNTIFMTKHLLMKLIATNKVLHKAIGVRGLHVVKQIVQEIK